MRVIDTQTPSEIARWFVYVLLTTLVLAVTSLIAQDTEPNDPAAWGSDHVGGQLPMYMTGDECLFCHRDLGETWQWEQHSVTMRVREMLPANLQRILETFAATSVGGGATHVLGEDRGLRLLRPNGAYGQFAIHGSHIVVTDRRVVALNTDAGWDDSTFARECAGCHATAVETESKAFSAFSLDCFVCHGDTPQGHQNEPAMALFAKSREAEPLVEISTCSQCHLRGGASKSSGLPYPNQFVPGDNLFKDFEVDLSPDALARMSPGDRHIFANVRDVVLGGRLDMTCTTCHSVHSMSSRKHRVLKRLQRGLYCAICHDDPDDYSSYIAYERHSAVCQY